MTTCLVTKISGLSQAHAFSPTLQQCAQYSTSHLTPPACSSLNRPPGYIVGLTRRFRPELVEPFFFRKLLLRFAPCHNRRPLCLQLTTLAAVAGIDVPLAASPDVVCHLVAGLPSAASALHGEDTFLSVSNDTQDRLIFVMSQLRLLYISTTVLMASIAYETLPAPDVIAQLTLKSYQDVFFHLGALISLNLNGHTLPRVPVKVPRADVMCRPPEAAGRAAEDLQVEAFHESQKTCRKSGLLGRP